MAVKPPDLQQVPFADDAGPPEVFATEAGMAPVIAIGGLLSDRTPWRVYSGVLAGGHRPESETSASERFLAILEGGLASFEDMYKQIEEDVQAAYERAGEPLVVVGQSLGGFFGTEMGVDHPEWIDEVVCLAGGQAGIKGEKPAAKLLKHFVGNPATAADLQEDSALMTEHREKIASEWSEDTGLHAVSPTFDVLIAIQQGLKLKLPDGQRVEKRVVVPRLPLVRDSWMRRAIGVPDDAELIKSIFGPVDHFNIALIPAVISYIREVRRQTAENASQSAGSKIVPSPLEQSQSLALAV